MEKHYRLDIGYNGADVSDIAVQITIPIDRVHWLVGLIQSGFQKEGIASGFVNVVGKDTFVSFTRHHYITHESKLPKPLESDSVHESMS